MKIVTVIGTRPQFVKASVVSLALSQENWVTELLVETGQHYDRNMSTLFFEQLRLPSPRYYLNVGSHSHGVQTALMLKGVETVLVEEKPDLVLVYGDTNSTLAGSLAAAKLNIPVAHVEAGLRSFNRRMPEEINRVLTDHMSELLFAPTINAVENLKKEGVMEKNIFFTGDVMYDAALYFGSQAETMSTILQETRVRPKEFALITVHRAENTDDREKLGSICRGLARIAKTIPVIWPLHPRTRKALIQWNFFEFIEKHVKIIPPVGYLDMVMLEKHALAIVTDSGGVQKEAFFHRVPCVTLRTETEWPELVELGWNRIVPPDDPSLIETEVQRALGISGMDAQPYGDGQAAHKVVSVIRDYYGIL
nr:UDP-N-acetylglucosamine 2-epimerase (non-hydrolyzing) [Kyrpidia sp.]